MPVHASNVYFAADKEMNEVKRVDERKNERTDERSIETNMENIKCTEIFDNNHSQKELHS